MLQRKIGTFPVQSLSAVAPPPPQQKLYRQKRNYVIYERIETSVHGWFTLAFWAGE